MTDVMSHKHEFCGLDFRTARSAFMRLSIVAALIGAPSSARLQTPADSVAAQVRSQGYQCDEPVSAVRDVELSRPDSAVWVLKCANATYRVRLDPGMAAAIDRL
jgi:hypothetical protein